MENTTLRNYQALIGIDATLTNYSPQYPFRLNEQATYTQHQITLYQSNYCHTDTEQSDQPDVVGGNMTDIVLIEM